jgi:hypothetical protein
MVTLDKFRFLEATFNRELHKSYQLFKNKSDKKYFCPKSPLILVKQIKSYLLQIHCDSFHYNSYAPFLKLMGYF